MTDIDAMTPEERAAYKRRIRYQRYHAEMMADPELHARHLAYKRDQRAARKARKAMPAPTVDVAVQRTYGPWAPLFALQAAA